MRQIFPFGSLIVLFFVFITDTFFAQNSQEYAHNSLAEKIYLQVDNDIYTTNKTIWFKAILINATTHSPTLSSGILYVDLINANETIVESKLIKIEDGIGNGHFDLDRSYTEGVYLIRAYTEWNKNFDSDYIFKKKIQVFSETKENGSQLPIRNIRRVDTSVNSQRFKADVFPELIDKSHKENLMFIVAENGIRDTVIIKKKNDKYVIDYEILKETQLVELAFKTSNNQVYKTSFLPHVDFIDLQFFPESGIMVDGLSSKIGFKAVDARGKGKLVEGVILNENDDVIKTFQSNELGMGSFELDTINADELYKAKVKLNTNVWSKAYKLPKAFKSGYVLSISSKKDKIYIEAKTNTLPNSKVRLKVTCRGFEYYDQDITLINGSYIYVIPKHTFPEGVLALTLFDNTNLPVAERLYFNQRLDTRLKINPSTNKSVYSKRARIDLKVNVTRLDTIYSPTNLSILVVNKDNETNTIQNDNILSYFLLSSDIRGIIERPSFYFEDGNEKELDHLLLTQGWRKYKYLKPIRKRNFKLERNLNVSGVINLKQPKSEKKAVDFMLMAFDDKRSMYTNNIEIPGSFYFELNDMYGKDKQLIVEPLKSSGLDKSDLNVSFNKKASLPVSFDFSYMDVVADSVANKVVDKNRAYKLAQDVYNFNTYGTTLLDEVIVDAYKLSPERKKVFDRYGAPNVVIDGDDIRAESTDKSTGLFSVLNTQTFMKDVLIERDSSGRLSAKTRKGGKGHITLFIIDGIPVLENGYQFLEYIATEEVTSFEIIDNPKQLKRLFAITYSTVPPQGPLYGSIISIYTRAGKGLFGALKATNKDIKLNTIPVFSVPKEFYAPQYDSNSFYDAANPDLRLPLYWKPQLITDTNGESTLNFYHSDSIGDFRIIIEAISKSGEIGYTTLDYTVRNNND